MQLITFGYDKDPQVYQRGIARPDWSLKALEDGRGYGWQIVCPYGSRSRHMTKAEAEAILLAV